MLLFQLSAQCDLSRSCFGTPPDLTLGKKRLKRNIEGVASECILRVAIVQQIEERSFRDVIERVDDSEMLRFFCRFYDDPVISHSKYATLVNMKFRSRNS